MGENAVAVAVAVAVGMSVAKENAETIGASVVEVAVAVEGEIWELDAVAGIVAV